MTLDLLPRVSNLFEFGWRFKLVFACFGLALIWGCKNQSGPLGSESDVSSGGSMRNGGFRILPQMAARDPLRVNVIYRCNDVLCGEAFQPSNEERDLFIPCGLEANLYPGGRLPPFLRVVTVAGKQKLTVRSEHSRACGSALPFEKVVATVPSQSAPATTASATECRGFRENREQCVANEAQGCRWVTHPSGRGGGRSGTGDCVGLFRSPTRPSGLENVQSIRQSPLPVNWAPVESYRPVATWGTPQTK